MDQKWTKSIRKIWAKNGWRTGELIQKCAKNSLLGKINTKGHNRPKMG